MGSGPGQGDTDRDEHGVRHLEHPGRGEHRDEVARLDPRAATKTFTVKELVRLLEDLPSPERGGGREWLAARIAAERLTEGA